MKLQAHAALLALTLLLPTPSSATDIQGAVESILAEEGLTGVAWVLVTPDQGARRGSAGFQDNLRQTPFALDTRFHVGSVTKALLATGILRLISEGRIDLDGAIRDYLPGLAIDNPWQDEMPITVRHLLDHTAGFDDARLWQLFSTRPTPDVPLARAFPEELQLLRSRVQPGTRFSYSNMGYGVLGLLIEAVTGEPYEAYLDRALLRPLDMLQSTFSYTTQTGDARDLSLAWGHIDDGSRYSAAPIFLRPAGQFTTTTADLARFAGFIMSDGTLSGRAFIWPQLMRGRGKPVGTDAADAGLQAGYALGLGRRDRYGVIGHCHSGNIVGFMAMLCVYPEEGKAFAYSVNTDSETANYGRLEELFVGALVVTKTLEPPTLESGDVSAWEGYFALSPNRFDSFRYLDELFGAVRFKTTQNGAELAALLGEKRVLRPTGPLMYSAGDRRTTSHALLRSADGAYLVSDGFRTYEKRNGAVLALHWMSLLAGLIGMVSLLATGIWALVRGGRLAVGKSEVIAAFGVLALLIPVPLFFFQPFMALGDLTLASGALAVVTGLLPLSMMVSLVKSVQTPQRSWRVWLDRVAALAVIQWCVALYLNDLLPMALWT